MATSKKEAALAGKELGDSKTPKKDRGPIAAALAQAKKPKKQAVEKCRLSERGQGGRRATEQQCRRPAT